MAQLVGRLVWDQDAGSSSLPTRMQKDSASAEFFSYPSGETRTNQCNADARCRRRLDGDAPQRNESPHSDPNRQFSVRKPAVLTFWKGFSLFIAVQIPTYHSAPKSDLQYEISWSVNSSLFSDLHTECSIVKSSLPQSSNVVYPSDG